MPSEQHQTIVQMLRSRPTPAVGKVGIEEMRKGMEAMASASPLADGTTTESVTAGGAPAEWVEVPGACRDGALLYLHGGGYALGSLDTHRGLASRLSHATGLRVLLVDCRLAPENPYPAAVEDATSAYRWLLSRDIDPLRIAIGGDSAGGGLTLATLVALRDAGDPLSVAAVCLSPWVDLEGTGESLKTRAEADPMVGGPGLRWMAGLYLDGADPRTPLASPLYADLADLPPLLIQVGTAEVLLDDSTRLAERALSQGVEAEVQAFEDLVHVFQSFAPLVPEAVEAIDDIGRWVRERLAAQA